MAVLERPELEPEGAESEDRMNAEAKQRIRWIESSIRYNDNPPPVTTMSGCMECGQTTRGGGLCSDCLRAMIERIRGKDREVNREHQRERRRQKAERRKK